MPRVKRFLYQNIPPEIRKQAQEECERFVQEHIHDEISFATETTLGGRAVATEQARQAKEVAFFTTIGVAAREGREQPSKKSHLSVPYSSGMALQPRSSRALLLVVAPFSSLMLRR